MPLKRQGAVELPAHVKPGGFDHAAIHSGLGLLFVAHTANDAVDVIDIARGRFSHSIDGLTGVAGVLVCEEQNLVLTSNRGENAVGIFSPERGASLTKIPVGIRPNGLAYAPIHNRLLAAHGGDPAIPDSFTVSMVDVGRRETIANIPVAGRTRWTLYDGSTDTFYVNIADPAVVAVIDGNGVNVEKTYKIPAKGPHGLDLDFDHGILYCACDEGRVFSLEAKSGRILDEVRISGAPDVIFLNPALGHLYVAIGDPGVLEIVETRTMKLLETVPTEKGAHTIAFDSRGNRVFAFLPQTHRAAVFLDD